MSVSISALSVRMQKDNNVFSYFACGTTWRRTAPCECCQWQQQQCEQLKALACWKRRFMAAYSTPPTQTHTHTRVNREDPIEEELQKNAAITKKMVCKISERKNKSHSCLTARLLLFCCCCCGCCPYSWLYCFSQLWASCGPSQGAGSSQFKRRMSLQWFAELLRRKVCCAFY